jgi:hypothetical protein
MSCPNFPIIVNVYKLHFVNKEALKTETLSRAHHFVNSGSQPFLARGTLNTRKNFAAHLYLKKLRKTWKRASFYKLQPKSPHFIVRIVKVRDQKELAAHLERAHGTLVCRGTPVEKH